MKKESKILHKLFVNHREKSKYKVVVIGGSVSRDFYFTRTKQAAKRKLRKLEKEFKDKNFEVVIKEINVKRSL